MLATIALASGLACAEPPERPNIVFILADDMGYGDAGCYNADSKAPTPHIDRLGREGIRFTDAHAPGAVCVPSRYGLMTGRYPMRAVLRPGRQACIPEGRMTIASLLRDNGYRTAMIGKWHLGFDDGPDLDWSRPLAGGPVDRGFDTFFGIPASLDIPPYYFIRDRTPVAPPTDTIPASATEGWSPIQGAFWRAGGVAPGFDHEQVLPMLGREAEGVIDRWGDGSEPFFLYVALTAPHTPWLPLPEFRGRSGAGLYGDFVAQVDDTVGRILDALDRNGLRDDTLVFFSSDNGPVWYEADETRFGHRAVGPLRGMKADAWEGGHRVPFVARWPGRIPAAATTHETLCFTDMLATVAAVVGATVPTDAGDDSFDMLPALLGAELDGPIREATVHKQAGTAIRAGRWKLINHLGSGGFSRPGRVDPVDGGPTGQLYDLEADPGETRNLWMDEPEVVARLLELLRRQREQGRTAPVSERPNFVVILADDMGYGDSSVYGGWIETPSLARMASEGLTFTDFHTSGVVCSPTRAGLVTGRYQQRAGIPAVINADPALASHHRGLQPEEVTFAELLSDAGYRTAIFGKWHLGYFPEHNPVRHGFERFRGFVSGNIDYTSHYDRMQKHDWWDGEQTVEEAGYLTHLLTDHAVRFIDEHADEPFCLYVPHGAMHTPLQAADSP
ncbi:MAG: sulfatase-like hydrolase/transferase, partial [Planctomycetota bacterium]